MKTKIFLAVAALFSAPAFADFAAWRVEPVGLAPIDIAVDVSKDQILAFPDDVIALGLDITRLTTSNGLIDLSQVGQVSVDELHSILKIDTKPELLPTNKFDLHDVSMYQIPDEEPAGTFLNYDLRLERTTYIKGSGLFEFNTFWNGMRVNWQQLIQTGSIPQRISGSLSKDDLNTSTTWLVGDGTSAAGTGVAPVRSFGAQLRKDFGLAPGFITSPTADLKGVAAAPTTVEVLINNQLIRSQKVGTGPFDITNIQPMSGAGTMTMLMTDVTGLPVAYTTDVVGNAGLLKPDLIDFGLQAGVLRTSLAHTEDPFVSGFYKRGFESNLTGEINAEVSNGSSSLPPVNHIGGQVVGGTKFGNISAGARVGTGNQFNVSYQNSWYSRFNSSLSASITKSSDDYQQLGGGLVSPLQYSISGSVRFDRVSVSGMHSSSFGQRLTTFSAVYSPRQPSDITWSGSFTNLSGRVSSNTLSVFASIPLDSRLSAGRGRTHQSNSMLSSDGLSVDYTNRPINQIGGTFKGKVEAYSAYKREELNADFNSFNFEVGGAVSAIQQTQNNQTGLRGCVRGAVVKDRNDFLFGKWVSGGYAVVDAKVQDIDVLLNGSKNTRTNKAGKAVVSGLHPYLKSTVQLDPTALPDNFDEVSVAVSTHRKAGARVEFSGHNSLFIKVPGIKSGEIEINGKTYPLTARGAFVDLRPGVYWAWVNKKMFEVSVPFLGSEVGVVEAKQM